MPSVVAAGMVATVRSRGLKFYERITFWLVAIQVSAIFAINARGLF